jgi:hypothetical protein
MIARTVLTLTTGAVLSVAAFAAPAQVRAAPAALTSAKSLALTLTDVRHAYGASFRLFIAHTYPASKYTTCGANYLGAYVTSYGNFAKASSGHAVVSVGSTVDTFANNASSACAAKAGSTNYVKLAQKQPGQVKVHLAPLSGIGDTAFLLTMVVAKQHSYSTMIQFSRGRYGAILTVSATGEPASKASVLALARLEDARLQAASR